MNNKNMTIKIIITNIIVIDLINLNDVIPKI